MRSWNNRSRADFTGYRRTGHLFISPSTVLANCLAMIIKGASQSVVGTRFMKKPAAWIEWRANLRLPTNDIPSFLTASMDELGRAMYGGARKANANDPATPESTLYTAFKKVQEGMVAPHDKIQNYGLYIAETIEDKSLDISVSYDWSPASVGYTIYPQLPNLREANETETLFMCPSLSQPWSRAIANSVASIDMIRWRNDTICFLADKATLSGVSNTARTAYDLMNKLTQMKTAVALFSVYEIQPLVAYARMVLPFYQYVQQLHVEKCGENERLVKRGASLVECVQYVASLPLIEVLEPMCSAFNTEITAETIWGSLRVVPMVARRKESNIFVDPRGKAAQTSTLHQETGLPAGVTNTNWDLIAEWRSLLMMPPQADAKWSSLYTVLKVEKKSGEDVTSSTEVNWVSWRTVATVLQNFMSAPDISAVVGHLGWSLSRTNVGAFKIETRGSDFMWSDAERYQGNVWQACLGITPALLICNRISDEYAKKTQTEFGVSSQTIRRYAIGLRGIIGDDSKDQICERYYIPKSASCKEDNCSDAIAMEENDPAVAAYYKKLLVGVVNPYYEQEVPKTIPPDQKDLYTVINDSWDGCITSVKDVDSLKKGISNQWSNQMQPVEKAVFVHKPEGFNMRVLVRQSRSKSLYISDRWGMITGHIDEPGDVIFDSDDDLDTVLGGGDHQPISQYVSSFVSNQSSVHGGVVIGTDFFSERA